MRWYKGIDADKAAALCGEQIVLHSDAESCCLLSYNGLSYIIRIFKACDAYRIGDVFEFNGFRYREQPLGLWEYTGDEASETDVFEDIYKKHCEKAEHPLLDIETDPKISFASPQVDIMSSSKEVTMKDSYDIAYESNKIGQIHIIYSMRFRDGRYEVTEFNPQQIKDKIIDLLHSVGVSITEEAEVAIDRMGDDILDIMRSVMRTYDYRFDF